MRTGSLPCRFDCSDGETYYTKHVGNNQRHVINEFIGARLLQFLELPTPDIAFVEVNPEAFDGAKFAFNREPYGLAFGSRQLQGQSNELLPCDLYKGVKIRKLVNTESLIGIVLFDLWVCNTDRRSDNPNILFEQNGQGATRLVAIDHAMIIAETEYSVLPSEITLQYWLSIRESLISHPLYREIHDSLGLFAVEESDRILNRIEGVEERDLYVILSELPDEWGVKGTDRQAIIHHFLLSRKNLVREVYQRLLIEAKILEA